jgi:hypothetical protein
MGKAIKGGVAFPAVMQKLFRHSLPQRVVAAMGKIAAGLFKY